MSVKKTKRRNILDHMKEHVRVIFNYSHYIYTNKAKRNLFACVLVRNGRPCHDGMAPCFGHTRVTFDVENDRPGPSSLRGHFEATQGRFLRLKALF